MDIYFLYFLPEGFGTNDLLRFNELSSKDVGNWSQDCRGLQRTFVNERASSRRCALVSLRSSLVWSLCIASDEYLYKQMNFYGEKLKKKDIRLVLTFDTID